MSVDPLSQGSMVFYAITCSAGAYALFSQYVTRRFGNQVRVKEIQKEMNDINKRYSESLKSKDESKVKKAEADQSRVPKLMMEMMMYQFKPMLILLPVLFIFPAFLRSQFPGFEITLPVDVPVFLQHFERFPNWRHLFGTYGWFWVAVIFISLLASLLAGAVNRAKERISGKKAV